MNITPIPAFSDNYIWMMTRKGRAAVVDPGDPAPVFKALDEQGLTLDTIIITHHHFDHTGGVAALKSATDCRVIGPDNPKITDINEVMSEGTQVTVLGYDFRVMEVPGHTLDHIAYYSAEARLLFCGDTLFAGGCGRMFEGTAPQMHSSLARLAALPGDTAVYCAHEYTLANLRFAKAVEPENAALLARIDEAEALRAAGTPTVPTSIALERATNPFLRTEAPSVRQALAAQDAALEHAEPSACFAALRGWKDRF